MRIQGIDESASVVRNCQLDKHDYVISVGLLALLLACRVNLAHLQVYYICMRVTLGGPYVLGARGGCTARPPQGRAWLHCSQSGSAGPE